MKTKVDVQVGISCEKIEIDPLQQATSARFWSKQKAVSYDMDNVVSCEVIFQVYWRLPDFSNSYLEKFPPPDYFNIITD